ncbi:MAG TPA: hypothetical protein VKB93_02765 [Thermoanaerobaculia bacterium]|nr:hypothetical protein [Thermoanaerobaculia bacterium]
MNRIDGQIRATRHRFAPRAARAISARDHFTQRNPQREIISNDIHVVEQEHSPT